MIIVSEEIVVSSRLSPEVYTHININTHISIYIHKHPYTAAYTHAMHTPEEVVVG